MSEVLKPDLCVIGAGAGGAAAAAAAAALKASVVLIEKSRMGGGDLAAGGIPAQALREAAQIAHDMRRAAQFGLRAVVPQVDPDALRAHVRGVAAQAERDVSQARFEAMNVRVIRAQAKFLSSRALDAGGVRIEARRFVIATGSTAGAPPAPGIELVRALTTDTFFDLDHLPERLIVLGAQANGLMLAQTLRRLGSAVAVIDGHPALEAEDPELAGVVLDALGREGVRVAAGIGIERIEPLPEGLRVFLADGQNLEGTDLLIAAGRSPNIGGLGLEAAGVTFDRRGVKVDASLRTSNSRIYAIGDVTGMDRSVQIAQQQAGVAVRAALFGLPAKLDENLAPRVVWTDPGLATVGLGEKAARARYGAVEILRWPFSENAAARAMRRPQGHVKVITDRHGVILGAGIAGPRAAEQIGLWQGALAKRMKIANMAELAPPSPTLPEASRRAALSGYAETLRNPWLGRVLRLMRMKG